MMYSFTHYNLFYACQSHYTGTSSCAPPPKRITRSDVIARTMLENVLCDVGRPWEQPITVGVSASRGTARKIPALRSTDVFWPWPLIRRDFLQPVWKQQFLFKLFRHKEERRMEYMRRIGFTEQYRQYYLDQLRISLVRCIVFQKFIALCNLCPLLV